MLLRYEFTTPHELLSDWKSGYMYGGEGALLGTMDTTDKGEAWTNYQEASTRSGAPPVLQASNASLNHTP